MLQPGWEQHPQGSGSAGAHLVLGEELTVAPFQDVQLRVVQAGVLVARAVFFPDEPAPLGHSRERVSDWGHFAPRL